MNTTCYHGHRIFKFPDTDRIYIDGILLISFDNTSQAILYIDELERTLECIVHHV